jgi:hypothetical protein
VQRPAEFLRKTVHADEQRRPDVAAERRRWRAWLPLRDAVRYVFIDECGVTTDLLRRYGRSLRGVRLRDHALRPLGNAHHCGGAATGWDDGARRV